MKYLFALPLFILAFTACNDRSAFIKANLIDVSEFTIDTTALEDGAEVEILGLSGNLTEEDEQDFYNLVVVRNRETGDTVNVLMTSWNGMLSQNPYARFLSNSSDIGKLFERMNSEGAEGTQNVRNLKAKTFDQVFYDSEFIQLDVRRYPAVTGTLGDYVFEGVDWKDLSF